LSHIFYTIRPKAAKPDLPDWKDCGKIIQPSMKNYAKIGKTNEKPAYRTPGRFIYKKSLEARKATARTRDLASRLEFRKIRNKKFRKKPN
jgi:hypothetical protein